MERNTRFAVHGAWAGGTLVSYHRTSVCYSQSEKHLRPVSRLLHCPGRQGRKRSTREIWWGLFVFISRCSLSKSNWILLFLLLNPNIPAESPVGMLVPSHLGHAFRTATIVTPRSPIRCTCRCWFTRLLHVHHHESLKFPVTRQSETTLAIVQALGWLHNGVSLLSTR